MFAGRNWTDMPLLTISVPFAWYDACDKGLRMLVLNIVLWILAVNFLGSDAPASDMLVLASFSVVGMFVYYMIIKRYIFEITVKQPNHRQV